jgi:hypothetical protein
MVSLSVMNQWVFMRVDMMHFVPALVITSGFLLASAQKGGSESLLARLSHSNTYGMDWRTEQRSPRICILISLSGQYRLLRQTERGHTTVEGSLSDEEMSRVVKELMDLDLYAESRGNLVLRGPESFKHLFMPQVYTASKYVTFSF